MKLVTRELPTGWYDNEAIIFVGEDPEPFEVEITTATHASFMFTPYAPDEVHSFTAKLMAVGDCLIVEVSQFSFILDPPTTKCRWYRSADRGRVWNSIDDAEASVLLEGQAPRLIFELI